MFSRSLVVLSMLTGSTLAQPCTPGWSDQFRTEGLSGVVNAVCTFDPDGAGPLPPLLVAAGRFAAIGNQPAGNIAAWDGASWSPLGAGVTGVVYSLAVFDFDGPGPEPARLVAGGSMGSGASAAVEIWDGQAWSAPAAFLNGYGYSMTVFDDDGPGPDQPALVVGGFFANPSASVMRWNGSGWAPMGGDLGGYVFALAGADLDGAGPNPPSLYAGGAFGGYLARWTGSAWQTVSPGVDNAVHSLSAIRADGDAVEALYVGGDFASVGGVASPGIGKYTGLGFVALPGLVGGRVTAILGADDDGGGPRTTTVIALGSENGGTARSAGVSRLVNGSWVAMGQGFNGAVQGGTVWNDGVHGARAVAVGAFTNASWSTPSPVINAPRVAEWDGAAWSAVGSGTERGLNDFGNALAAFDDDGPGPHQPTLYVGGRFSAAGGVPVRNIARFDGRAFSPVGAGLNSEVHALVVHDDDGGGPHAPALYAGGYFLGSGSVTAYHVARWDGVKWSGLSTALGIGGDVYALASFDPDGAGPLPPYLVAAGTFTSLSGPSFNSIARWDGSAWSAMGAGLSGYVYALAVYDPDGDGPLPASLYAAGSISPGNIARWDGAAWQPVGGGVSGQVSAMAVYDDDGPGPHPPRLYVGGSFSSAGGVPQVRVLARWDGAAWTGVPGTLVGSVQSLAAYDQDGDGVPELYVSGLSFGVVGFPSIYGIVRFDGSAWSALGSGLDLGAFAMAGYDDDGAGPRPPGLFATGRFSVAGGVSSEAIARWGCPLPVCYANCDGSTAAPALNVLDFICFLDRFAASEPYANCDGSTTPPVLNALDFACFLNAFGGGCP